MVGSGASGPSVLVAQDGRWPETPVSSVGGAPPAPASLPGLLADHDGLVAARRSLRDQIARLEREIASEVAAGARVALPRTAAPGRGGARLLGLADLERVRDDLVATRAVLRDREHVVDRNRELLEEVVRDPARHRRVRLTLAEVGEAGCGTYAVRPHLGLLGRMMGWWRLKLSLGCPLAMATRRARKRARRRPSASSSAPTGDRPAAAPSDHAAGRGPGHAAEASPGPSVQVQRGRDPRSLSSRDLERPPAPWGPVPVTELAILVGLVVASVGVLGGWPRASAIGVLVVVAASGELALREHRAGYRSHTALLAGLPAVVAVTGSFFLLRAVAPGVPVILVVVPGALVFAAMAAWLRRAFRDRTGVSMRV